MTVQIHRIVQRSLSETEEKTIQHFRYYYDNRRCFALIGDYVIVALSSDNILSDDTSVRLEKLKQEALDNMLQIMHTPPDFTTYVMDDKFGLVEMNYGVYGVSQEMLSEEELEAGEVNIATALVIRAMCLEACEAGSIIALNDEEGNQ